MTNAHMFISEPAPLQGYSPKDPLDKSGSNWPCHGAPLPTSGGQKLQAGETFPLKFDMGGENHVNTATHGGGSCQLAVLYDTTKAADPSAWNVIYSIEGGCPSNTKGNLAEGYPACSSPDQGDCVHSWDIPMPKGVKSGNAILSWTWFNTIGNREMYQNCANVDIEGGSGDGQFPPIFVANLASVNDVHTSENTDVLFPEPGEFVTTMSATNGYNYPKATVGAAQGGNQGAPSSYAAPAPTSAPAYSAPAYSAPVASSAPASSASAYGSPAYSAPPNVQSGVQSYNGQKGRETQTTFATSARTSVAATSSAVPAPTGYSSGSSNSESNNTSSDSTCTSAGSYRCDNGGKGFSVCDQGKWVSMGRTSAGTKCESGVIQKRSSASRFRRHLHAHKH